MKFTCERDKILSAFQTAATVAPSRSPKPILQNVKMIVGEQEATLLATDMEVAIRLDVPGIQVEAAGQCRLARGAIWIDLAREHGCQIVGRGGSAGNVGARGTQ